MCLLQIKRYHKQLEFRSRKTVRLFQKEIIGQNIAVIYTEEDQVLKIHLQEMHKVKINGRGQDVRWHVK